MPVCDISGIVAYILVPTFEIIYVIFYSKCNLIVLLAIIHGSLNVSWFSGLLSISASFHLGYIYGSLTHTPISILGRTCSDTFDKQSNEPHRLFCVALWQEIM